MPFLKFAEDEIVKRLRWVMAGLIIFSMVITLVGQPAAYWQNPAMAMRGDGLSINDPTNHTFEFCLGSGWAPFFVAALVYLTAMFLLASVLPRKPALVLIFSVIFSHYYDASNWLAVRWHMGIPGPTLLGLVLAPLIVLTAFPDSDAGFIVKNTRWVMLFALLADATVTLIGQPAGYWHNPSLVYEGNAISKFFMQQGWWAYALEQVAIVLVLFRLINILSYRWALTLSFGFTFMGFIGSANWLFYNWRLGWPVLVCWACILNIGMVFSIFRGKAKRNASENARPVSPGGVFCSLC